jgi:hypothetical protein
MPHLSLIYGFILVPIYVSSRSYRNPIDPRVPLFEIIGQSSGGLRYDLQRTVTAYIVFRSAVNIAKSIPVTKL